MSKEKLISLTKYANDTKAKLSDNKVPEKHKNRPEAYRLFLQGELNRANATIESLKMTVPTEAKK